MSGKKIIIAPRNSIRLWLNQDGLSGWNGEENTRRRPLVYELDDDLKVLKNIIWPNRHNCRFLSVNLLTIKYEWYIKSYVKWKTGTNNKNLVREYIKLANRKL
jgi:hypothetical protein